MLTDLTTPAVTVHLDDPRCGNSIGHSTIYICDSLLQWKPETNGWMLDVTNKYMDEWILAKKMQTKEEKQRQRILEDLHPRLAAVGNLPIRVLYIGEQNSVAKLAQEVANAEVAKQFKDVTETAFLFKMKIGGRMTLRQSKILESLETSFDNHNGRKKYEEHKRAAQKVGKQALLDTQGVDPNSV